MQEADNVSSNKLTKLLQRFAKVEIEDREWAYDLYRASGFFGSEYNFSSSFIWKDIYDVEIAHYDDFALVRTAKGGKYSYLYPSGHGEAAEAIEAMMAIADEEGHPFRLHSMSKEALAYLEEHFPGQFSITETRDNADYIYEREKLATLSGKKLHSKRNHIHRFTDNHPDWTYEKITRDNLDECRAMSARWYALRAEETGDDLSAEQDAVKKVFDYFFELELRGGLIRTGGEIVALSIGAPLNDKVFQVHIEKAFPEMQGAYPMINQQFVINECEGFVFVNREDDLGEEGLRKAKLSYYPAIILEKYIATLINDPNA